MAEKHTHNCVRCKIPLEATWGHAQCGLCKRELAAMHAALEYTMFRKTYYTCSTEGTSLEWLLKNGYAKDIILPTTVRSFVIKPAMVEVPRDYVYSATNNVVNSS